MRNLSIASFRSPIHNSLSVALPMAFAVSRTIQMSHCNFNKYFDPVFYSATERIHASFLSSSFRNTLSTAIHIESEGLADMLREKEEIRFRVNVPHSGSTVIRDCVFDKCKTRGSKSPLDCGGAIYMRANFPSNDAEIVRCGFRDCMAANIGGCVYFLGNNLTITMCEFKSSNATSGAAVYSESSEFNANFVSLRGSFSTYDGVLSVSGGTASLHGINETNNKANKGRGVIITAASTDACRMRFFLISRVRAGNLVFCNACKNRIDVDSIVMLDVSCSSPRVLGALAFSDCGQTKISVSHAVFMKCHIRYISSRKSQTVMYECVTDRPLESAMFDEVKNYESAFTHVSSMYTGWIQGPSPDVRICWAMGANIQVTSTFTASSTFHPTEVLQGLILHEKGDMNWCDFKAQVPSMRTKIMNIQAYMAQVALIVQ